MSEQIVYSDAFNTLDTDWRWLRENPDHWRRSRRRTRDTRRTRPGGHGHQRLAHPTAAQALTASK